MSLWWSCTKLSFLKTLGFKSLYIGALSPPIRRPPRRVGRAAFTLEPRVQKVLPRPSSYSQVSLFLLSFVVR